MKKLTLAAVFAAIAFPAVSGNLSQPVMEPKVTLQTIEAGTSSSSQGILVPVFLLLTFGAALAN
ncbi:MAG: hypothetical protein CSA68_00360 [Rhodobacterales bacterium]|nr:MAG: hypothetical protein CSA68_00360 [Rhodobacterales bacterium]